MKNQTRKSYYKKNKKICSIIKKWLKKRNISIAQFALMVGVDKHQIYTWLSGKHNFTIKTLVKIELSTEIKLLNF